MNINKNLVIVRGGGDIASGTIQKLYRSGFKVLVLEIAKPSSIRRKVSFGEAVYDGEIEIEGIKSRLCSDFSQIEECWNDKVIPIAIDPKGEYIKSLHPQIVVDAILAKKNMGTDIHMAPIVIALGPGFTAKKDCHVVIETMRGHNLGRLIFEGPASKNTGTPGIINGYGIERVIYSNAKGKIKNIHQIGDIVEKDDILAYIGDTPVKATISGVLRGIIRDGFEVPDHFKIADIDPRIEEQKNCFTISDKARAIGGAVLETILYLLNKGEER